jgi:hypothetical protein
MDEALKLIKDM